MVVVSYFRKVPRFYVITGEYNGYCDGREIDFPPREIKRARTRDGDADQLILFNTSYFS